MILAEKSAKNWKLAFFGQFQILINPLMPNEFGNFQKILLKFFKTLTGDISANFEDTDIYLGLLEAYFHVESENAIKNWENVYGSRDIRD